MRLDWAADEYVVVFESQREHRLVADSVIESAYIVDGLSDSECVARLGRTKVAMQRFIDDWQQFQSTRNLDVADLEFLKSCLFEALDFFSDVEYGMRTGWTKDEARTVQSQLLQDRRRITLARLWGEQTSARTSDS
jgi:hypothetical protein